MGGECFRSNMVESTEITLHASGGNNSGGGCYRDVLKSDLYI